jgi:leucyl aminopeptidase
MKYILKDIDPTRADCDALVLPVVEDDPGGIPPAVDGALGGLLTGQMKSGAFRGKPGEALAVATHGKIKPLTVVLAGLGPREKADAEALRKCGGSTARHLRARAERRAALDTSLIGQLGLDPADFAEGAALSQYEFSRYRKADDKKPLASLAIIAPRAAHKGLGEQLRIVEAVVRGVFKARDLITTPARDMTPSALALAARGIAGLSVKVIDRAGAGRLGMGAYLSVARGSDEPPRFIVATYKGGAGGGRGEGPIVLVGKSITFDSGGLSLKPGQSMEKMKYDMAGGAAVLGALGAAAELKLPLHVVGVLPATENLPSGRPSMPGDVVTALTGKTIEILNTDAEGRLVLADALGYAVKHLGPREVIDVATLTGACSSALGEEAAALFSNDDALCARVEAASAATGERVWRMPLFEEYGEYLKSQIADLQNISNTRSGGLVTAGYFLREFVGDTPWAHLDIAGTAWMERDHPYIPKGARGMGVRLLVRYLRDSCGA